MHTIQCSIHTICARCTPRFILTHFRFGMKFYIARLFAVYRRTQIPFALSVPFALSFSLMFAIIHFLIELILLHIVDMNTKFTVFILFILIFPHRMIVADFDGSTLLVYRVVTVTLG